MHSDKGSGVTIEPACDGSPQRERHTHWNARVCTTRFHKPAFIVCGNISHRTTSLSTVDFDAQSACRPCSTCLRLLKLIPAGNLSCPSYTMRAGLTSRSMSSGPSLTGALWCVGSKVTRRPQKRADYLLRYTRDFPIAVVEAKASYQETRRRPSAGQRIRGHPRAEIRLLHQRSRNCGTRLPDRRGDRRGGFPEPRGPLETPAHRRKV